ncbi:hypothetical protein O181_106755 [Austropuccinia psidii MF-1]|uniref:Uncharacterized protein n=1 Tax=Austropuccinia psidii MF-1 TaxID=1389203 RepID=A0A9Q3JT38_9BASI|nr:hypothetical protein [Austropuccinia psidii MF-1]
MTEITESSPSAPPPSVLCGSSVFSQLTSPSMASSVHFDPSQTYDGYRAVEVLDPACSELTGSRKRDVARWTNVGRPIPNGGRLIYSSSEVPISRINTEGVVKRIRRIADSPTDPDAERSDELDGEEVEVVPHLVVHPSSNSSAQPLANKFQKPSDSNYSQNLSTGSCFHSYYNSFVFTSTSLVRPALNQEVRQSPSQQARNSPITTSQQLQPMASSSRRRDGLSSLPFPAAKVFQRRDCWPIQITREDTNVVSENQEAVARLFRRVNRNSREVIMYANNRTIPGTASEEMTAKSSWYEDELINDFQRTFDDSGRDN